MPTSALPTQAALPTNDLVRPSADLLIGLNLLATEEDQRAAKGPLSVLTGPPQSVAVLEAGATAFTKWWAAGLGVSIVGLWGAVATWWGSQSTDVKVGAIWGTSVTTAALVLALAYIVGSDVTSRATAAVATINSRAHVAGTFVDNAAHLYAPVSPTDEELQVIGLPGLGASWDARPGPDETGWTAIAMRVSHDESIEFLLTKNGVHSWAPGTQVSIS